MEQGGGVGGSGRDKSCRKDPREQKPVRKGLVGIAHRQANLRSIIDQLLDIRKLPAAR